ncbi:hypothetical protein [Magnetospira sp. QH-2]|uniref:hypothetical protein n=1 Tax=Magnetospira sp. (strain QH-2) TaxID=1288970 RepID=UPI0003E8145D|nr:hypothetical protein [Magnetospira sp. QH-2]CCQ72864.1 exported protein of unknown function [Magnetospira sp. QH-2]
MKRLVKICVALVFTLAWTPVLAATSVESLSVGDTVRGEVKTRGGVVVPLPAGKWVVAGSRLFGKKNKWHYLVLAEVKDKVITRALLIRGNRSKSNKGFKKYAGCTSENASFKQVDANERQGDQDCFVVRAWCTRKHENTVSNFYRESLVKMGRAQDLFVPMGWVGWEVRLADTRRNMTYATLVASDLILPADTKRGHWILDDWKPDLVAASPAKQAVMDYMKTWGEQWRPRLKSAW